MTAVAAIGNLYFGAIMNTIMLTTDLLYMDLMAEDPSLSDYKPMTHGSSSSGAHDQRTRGSSPSAKGFDSEISKIDLDSIPAEKHKYVEEGEEAIEEVEYLLAQPGWKTAKSHRDGTVVKTLFFPKYAKNVMLLEAVLDVEPAKLIRDYWLNGEKAVEWNSDITYSKTMEMIGQNVRIQYSVSGELSALQPRDFLTVSARKKIGDAYFLCYQSTSHPKDPKNEDYVRAVNGPSGFVFRPLYDEQGKLKTKLQWVLNLDLNLPSALPVVLVEKMMPISMVKYLKDLKKHLVDVEK